MAETSEKKELEIVKFFYFSELGNCGADYQEVIKNIVTKC